MLLRGPDREDVRLRQAQKRGEAPPQQVDDWTYWLSQALRAIQTMNPMGAATQAVQDATVPETVPTSDTSRGLAALKDKAGNWLGLAAFLVPAMVGKFGGPLKQYAEELFEKLVQQLGPPPEGVLRLFHGGMPYKPGTRIPEGEYGSGLGARRETVGRWATPDPGYASGYGLAERGPLWWVDVPEEAAELFWMPNQPRRYRNVSFDWPKEYVLHPDYAERMQLLMPEQSALPEHLLNRTLTQGYGQRFGYPEGTQLGHRLEAQSSKGALDNLRMEEKRLELEAVANRRPTIGTDIYLDLLRNLADFYEGQ